MRTADFTYTLPPELIAQYPAARRDDSQLLVLRRPRGTVEHRRFRELPEFLRAGDVLVLNNSRVIPARLRGVNARTGGQFEILLLEENTTNDWWAMLRPGKRARTGTQIVFGNSGFRATVVEVNDEGDRRLEFSGTPDISRELDRLGEVPLPPYIRRQIPSATGKILSPNPVLTPSHSAGKEPGENFPKNSRLEPLNRDLPPHPALSPDGGEGGHWPGEGEESAVGQVLRQSQHYHPTEANDDRERYQTVYAKTDGSVAAPTAGLHFTEEMLAEIRAREVTVCFVTLHVGPGTFLPVKTETLAAHKMHEERYELGETTARLVNEAKATGRRVIAVGTTTVRVLEGVAAQNGGKLAPDTGRTRIFIYPPFDFKIADALLTNFHLPCSTLLMLVSAFAAPGGTDGRVMILSAYAEAIRKRYRFYSYGDAMLIL